MSSNLNKIQRKLNNSSKNGGKVTLKLGEYFIDKSLLIKSSCTNFSGEVWNYPNDPNGVFESVFGTKIKVKNGSYGLQIGSGDALGGSIVSNLGFQGSLKGMDTRTLFNKNDLVQNSGIVFRDGRVDQGEFSKLSFCGLSIGILATENSEVDACFIDKCNFDGCCVGIYYKPKATYYPKINNCVFADNPSYGIIVDGEGAQMHHLEICNNKFVRNCGANIVSDKNASIYFKDVNESLIYNNIIDDAGTFWFYDDNSTKNDERKIFVDDCVGILVKGNANNIFSNVITNSKDISIFIEGDNNVLMGNIVDKDVVIDGKNNVVNGLVFTKPSAKLILINDASMTTEIIGVEPSRIIRK